MCINRRFPSRRDILRLAALGIPALALGARTGRAFAASPARPTSLRVGDVEITRIVEEEGPMMTLSSFFSDGESGAKLADTAVEAHRSWLDRWALAADSTMIFSVQSLLVRTPRHLILVDTCLGGGAQEGVRSVDLSVVPYFAKLRAAGVKAEDVDFVLCTHLHNDHTGWNTYRRDGKLIPTFPNAKYVFARAEWDYWRQRKQTDWDFGYTAIRQSVLPLVDARRALLIEPPYQLDEECRIEPIYGHTPGQVSLRIASAGRNAVLTGDLMHHPVQCAEVEWESIPTVDRKLAIANRRKFLEAHAGRDVLVIPAHFPTPGVGRIVAHGATWRFERAA
jgi:glyoxylase-like metal-dependent hydrolase (beta-lactamase superfamily II)